jgi:prevent-host-death family protein
MARSVGVRELKENPGKFLRLVRDTRQELDITIRGQAVARLVPLEQRISDEELSEYWRRHDELADEIGRHWPEGFSAVDAIREQRRDL